MFNKNKFKGKVVEVGLSIKDVAIKLNIDTVTLYRKMNGQSDFTRNEIQLLREILSLDLKTADEIFFAD